MPEPSARRTGDSLRTSRHARGPGEWGAVGDLSHPNVVNDIRRRLRGTSSNANLNMIAEADRDDALLVRRSAGESERRRHATQTLSG